MSRDPGLAKGLDVVTASESSGAAARAAGMKVRELDTGSLDVVIDGADEIDPACHLLKGGGGALLREKILATAAERLIIVAETSKLVPALGTEMPLPIEIVRFGWQQTLAALERLSDRAEIRTRDGSVFVTENSNFIVDVQVGEQGASTVAATASKLPGVVEHGLFAAPDALVLGEPDGQARAIETAVAGS